MKKFRVNIRENERHAHTQEGGARATTRHTILAFAAAAILASCCAVVCATGCSVNDAASMQQMASTVYLSEVNAVAKDVNSQLSAFSQYVKDKDEDAMQTTYNNIQESIERISSTTVPDGMVDVHNSYIGGFVELQAALEDYIQFFREMKNSTQSADMLTNRIATIQNEYNQGINLMKQAEEKAAKAAL